MTSLCFTVLSAYVPFSRQTTTPCGHSVYSSREDIDAFNVDLFVDKYKSTKEFHSFSCAGVLRLGALRRQQPSLLHDPQQKLHDELVTPPPVLATNRVMGRRHM